MQLRYLKENSKVKFVETLDCAIRLGVDPRHADQMVRGTVSFHTEPEKKLESWLLLKVHKAQEALDAGADYAGFEEYLEKIKGGWTDVDVIVATPDTMADLRKTWKNFRTKRLNAESQKRYSYSGCCKSC